MAIKFEGAFGLKNMLMVLHFLLLKNLSTRFLFSYEERNTDRTDAWSLDAYKMEPNPIFDELVAIVG